MAATIVISLVGLGGAVFMVIFLCALHNERRSQGKCRIERILPHNVIDWDVDVKPSATPGVKHAVPRRKGTTPGGFHRAAMRNDLFDKR